MRRHRLPRRKWRILVVLTGLTWAASLLSAFGLIGVSYTTAPNPLWDYSANVSGVGLYLGQGMLFLTYAPANTNTSLPPNASFHTVTQRLPQQFNFQLRSWTYSHMGLSYVSFGLHLFYAVSVAYPCLALLLLTLYTAPPRPRKPTLGLCTHCGYDLRMTPLRCPECGTGALLPASSLPSTVLAQ